MKKRLGIIFAGIILLSTTVQVFANSPLRVGVYQNSPLVSIDEAGQAHGFVIDILEIVADAENFQIEYVVCEWSQCLDWLESGEIDLLGAIAYSAERAQRFDFTEEALITNWGQVFANPNEHIESFLDLEGEKLAVLREDIYTNLLMEILESFDISVSFVEEEDYHSVLAQVESGDADAGLINRLFASQYAFDYAIEETAVIFHPIEVRYAATKENHQEILAALDTHLSELKADQHSDYYQSLDVWFGSIHRRHMPDWIIGAMWFSGFLLLAFVFGSQILRVQVRSRTRELQEEISAHKHTDSTLKESEERYRRLAENAKDMLYRLSIPDGRFEYVSPASVDLFGYTPTEFYDPLFLVRKTIHPNWIKRFEEQWAKLVVGDLRPTYEYQIIHKSGEARWLHQRNVMIRDARLPLKELSPILPNEYRLKKRCGRMKNS